MTQSSMKVTNAISAHLPVIRLTAPVKRKKHGDALRSPSHALFSSRLRRVVECPPNNGERRQLLIAALLGSAIFQRRDFY